MKTTMLIALLTLSATTSFANEQPGANRGRFEQARTQMFAEFKAIESTSHKDRIRILQEADACIQAAANRDQYRACEEREKSAREHSNAEAKSRREALRSKAEGMRQAMAPRN